MGADFLQQLAVLLPPLVIAVTLHEAAHGFVAWRCGDPTALLAGRISINPLRHIDPMGTVVLPLIFFFSTGGKFFFGYAKPVPVNMRRLRNPRRDMVLVAAAGPAANFLIACVSALSMRALGWLPESAAPYIGQSLFYSVFLNVILGLFNLFPLPPLDGGRVAVGLLPRPLALPLARLEPKGMFIIFFIGLILPIIGGAIGVNLNILSWILGPSSAYLTNLILKLAAL